MHACVCSTTLLGRKDVRYTTSICGPSLPVPSSPSRGEVSKPTALLLTHDLRVSRQCSWVVSCVALMLVTENRTREQCLQPCSRKRKHFPLEIYEIENQRIFGVLPERASNLCSFHCSWEKCSLISMAACWLFAPIQKEISSDCRVAFYRLKV